MTYYKKKASGGGLFKWYSAEKRGHDHDCCRCEAADCLTVKKYTAVSSIRIPVVNSGARSIDCFFGNALHNPFRGTSPGNIMNYQNIATINKSSSRQEQHTSSRS